MTKWLKNKWVWVGIIVASTGLFFIFKGKEESPLSGVPTDIFLVQQEKVLPRDLKQEILLSGSIKAWEEAVLFPRVDGKLLKNVLQEGDLVKKHQTVSLIERDEVGAVYEPVVVPSTITGEIGRIYLDKGAHVTRSTPVALVVNQKKVRIVADIPERYAGDINKGQKAFIKIDAFPEKEVEAVLKVISPVVESANRSVTAEFHTDNPSGLLKSGMFAKVNILLKQKQGVLAVSNQSIYQDVSTGEEYVLVPSSDKKTAVRKNIKTGFKDEIFTEITEGLSSGEDILQFGYGLKDGSKIEIGTEG